MAKSTAIVHYIAHNNLVDRSRVDVTADPRVKYLFEDREAESARYFKKTGIFPINHCMVIKRSVYERNPWIALNLYSGFAAAMEQVRKDSLAWMALYYEMGLVAARRAPHRDADAHALWRQGRAARAGNRSHNMCTSRACASAASRWRKSSRPTRWTCNGSFAHAEQRSILTRQNVVPGSP